MTSPTVTAVSDAALTEMRDRFRESGRPDKRQYAELFDELLRARAALADVGEPKCAGTNCFASAANQYDHSVQCIAQHEASIAGKQSLPSTLALADVGECETCGGDLIVFTERDGDTPASLDECHACNGTGKQPRHAAEEGPNCGCREAGCPHTRVLPLPHAELVAAFKARIRDLEAEVERLFALSPAAHTAQVTHERERGDAFKYLAAEAIGEARYQEYRAELQPDEIDALKAGVMCLEAEALAHRHPTFSKGATKGDIRDGEREGRKASDDKLRHAATLRRLAEQGSAK